MISSVRAYSAGGWRVLRCSGNLSNGANAGLGYLNANNTSSNADSNISARPDAHQKCLVIYPDCGPCQNRKLSRKRAGRPRLNARGRMKQGAA